MNTMNFSSTAVIFVLCEIFHIVYSKNTPRELSVTADDDNNEPTCDELRKMWRHTKREMQQKSEITTMPRYKSTRYHEPFTYGWPAQARPRSAMKYTKPVYGRIVHSPDKFLYRNNIPDRFRSFDQVARMVGSPTYYTQTMPAAPPKSTFFRLDYPVRRPVLPVRISHIGRFQELQNVLRNERADEVSMSKLKDNTDSNLKPNTEDPEGNTNNEGYGAYSYQQSRAEDDDVTAISSKGRKLRGTSRSGIEEQGEFSGNKEDLLNPDLADDNYSISSTSKPISADENIPQRWALGEWKR